MKIKKLLAVLLTACLLVSSASLAASADNGVKTFDEVMSAAQTIDVPYSEDVSVSLGTDFSYPEDSNVYYGQAFKFTLTEETALSISFGGTWDTFIELYAAGPDGLSHIAKFDNDNLASGGESIVVSLDAGDYYLLAATHLFTGTTQRLEISKIDASSKDSLLKNGKEITSFPYEETSSITEESVYIDDEVQYGLGRYGVAYGFTIDEKKMMEISLGDTIDSSANIVMEIYKVEGGGYTRLQELNSDNYSGRGEKFTGELEAGEYCILGRVLSYTGPVSVHFKAEDLSSAVAVNEIIGSAVSVSDLPYSETLNTGSLTLISPEQNVGNNYFYGKAYAVDLQQDEALSIKLYDESEKVDLTLAVYTLGDSGDYEYVRHFETDNYYADGENVVFKADSSQTYYIVARSWGKSEFSGKLEIERAEISAALDFTGDTAPAPSQGDLWSWNAAEKILTLKDGFDILTFGSSAIRLPEGATLAVEDGATAVISCYSSNNDDAVYAEGDLTIDMGDGAVLEVNGLEGDAIDSLGTLTVTGPENAAVTPVIKCVADEEGLESGDDMVLKNCSFDILCSGDGIYAELDFTATDCNIKIVSDDQGMDVDNNGTVSKAVLTNCVLDILSRIDQAIEGDDVSLINCQSRLSAPKDDCIECNGVGIFTCTGGSLWATGEDHAINAVNKITLKDVKLYLESEGGSKTAVYSEKQLVELAIDGNFRLYDNDGQMIYEGKLTDALYNGNGQAGAKLVPTYRVTFYDEDGSPLKNTQIVEYGSAAEAPADPVKAATEGYTYTFAGWDKAFDVVSGDLEIYATYTATPVQTEPTLPDPDQDSNTDAPAGDGEQTENPDTDSDNTPADPPAGIDTPTDGEQTGGNQTGSNQTGGSQTGDTISPQTGDNSNIALWIALALASGAALMGTTLYSRRKKCSR